jgi:hypothetical protein
MPRLLPWAGDLLGAHAKDRLDRRAAHYVDHLVDRPLALRDEVEHRQEKLPILGQKRGQLAAGERVLGRTVNDLILRGRGGGLREIEEIKAA